MIDQSDLRSARNRYESFAFAALNAVPSVRRRQARTQPGRRMFSGICGTTKPTSANRDGIAYLPKHSASIASTRPRHLRGKHQVIARA